MSLLDDPRLDWSFLERYRFDKPRLTRELAQMKSGDLSTQAAIISGRIEPAPEVIEADFDNAQVRAAGEAALSAGEVAQVVLNGGMATRFGGVVKGVVEVFDGKSFIGLKAQDAKRAAQRYGKPLPLVLMNSFATEGATDAHLAEHDRFGLGEREVLSFCQSISIRITPEHELFITDAGKPSYHAPGHGDFFGGIRDSGVLGQLINRGVKYVLFSNVDNLGATIDPVVLGHHILAKNPMTVEVTEKRRTASGAWDKGGAPALVDGDLQLVEGFRFPADFPQERLPDFSTNNMLFDAQALDRDIPLTRHVVQKKVDGRAALQLESIACEASAVRENGAAVLPLTLLRVPREGQNGRFYPIKEPADLDAMRAVLKERLSAGWR